MAHTAHAQTFPYEAQFRRLMGEPNETVSAFVMYPWQDNVQVSLAELGNVPDGNVIRIASVKRPALASTAGLTLLYPLDTAPL